MWYIQDTVVCTVQVSFTRFIYEFYDSRVLEGGLPLAAVAFSPLHSAKDLPRTQAVLNREKWIFWSERISTSNPFSFTTVFSRRGDLWGTHIECITRETISPWRVTRVLSNKLANRNSGGGATTLKTSLIPLFPRSGEKEIYWELFGTRYKKYRTSYLSVEYGSWNGNAVERKFLFRVWGQFWGKYIFFWSRRAQESKLISLKNVIGTKACGDSSYEGSEKGGWISRRVGFNWSVRWLIVREIRTGTRVWNWNRVFWRPWKERLF